MFGPLEERKTILQNAICSRLYTSLILQLTTFNKIKSKFLSISMKEEIFESSFPYPRCTTSI